MQVPVRLLTEGTKGNSFYHPSFARMLRPQISGAGGSACQAPGRIQDFSLLLAIKIKHTTHQLGFPIRRIMYTVSQEKGSFNTKINIQGKGVPAPHSQTRDLKRVPHAWRLVETREI